MRTHYCAHEAQVEHWQRQFQPINHVCGVSRSDTYEKVYLYLRRLGNAQKAGVVRSGGCGRLLFGASFL